MAFIFPIIFVAAMVSGNQCPITTIINKTDTWTKNDNKVLNFVQDRCKIKYEDAPCVKKFIKQAERTYFVICGKK